MNYTHQIIRMERGATKGSGSPMWRCRTADGQPVNVFQHSDPAKNNARLFIDAGYFGYMEALKIGEAVEWSEHPIDVVMVSDGKWFEVTAVAPRPEAAEPDAMWMPDLKAYRLRANRTALNIVNHAVRCFDVEATGLRTDDEMIGISVVQGGEVLLDEFVKPAHPEKLLRKQKDGMCAADITGITPEMLQNRQGFIGIWDELHGVLDGVHWCAYNAAFDIGVLDRECSNAGRPLLTNAGVFDVAVIAAEYLGNWNEKRQWFEMLKLGEAASRLGVMVDVQHQAVSDATTTWKILKAIADDVIGAEIPF